MFLSHMFSLLFHHAWISLSPSSFSISIALSISLFPFIFLLHIFLHFSLANYFISPSMTLSFYLFVHTAPSLCCSPIFLSQSVSLDVFFFSQMGSRVAQQNSVCPIVLSSLSNQSKIKLANHEGSASLLYV